MTVALRDGREVLIRPIEPDDAGLLVSGLERLSEESRYRRFLSPKSHFSDAELRYLTEVDHSDHEALIAIDPATGQATAVARYVRADDDRESAEVAVVVADDWQAQGLGTAMVERLAERAGEEGIVRFTATVLGTNEAAQRMLRGLGALRSSTTHSGETELEIDLPARNSRAVVKEALRAAARGDLVVRWRASV